MARLLVLLAALACAPAAWPKEAAPAAADPALEARVMALSSELRCLVCQNQTIADSNAGLASDLREEIREMVRQGKSDRQIVAFMVDRYGDFVLYRPPLKATTALLWFGPLLLVLVGIVALFLRLARRRRAEEPPLAPGDEERARRLLDGGGTEAR
ncbi:MAG TPA: cytochrome c-type biogenesis protein [Burkholderiales bacterium]|nr:cytochrome c-type biogenesis protein [Burkholderiales bacterium]